jgi:hypothetical protein
MRKTVDLNSNSCLAEDHEFESRSPLEITCNKIIKTIVNQNRITKLFRVKSKQPKTVHK